jgi:hypothetical protein
MGVCVEHLETVKQEVNEEVRLAGLHIGDVCEYVGKTSKVQVPKEPKKKEEDDDVRRIGT